jgi:hypothetical protein
LASIDTNNQALGEKKKFEIVLMGYDSDKNAHRKYIKGSKMSWMALKLAENKGAKNFTKKGDTGFIPNLILLKPDGTMVSNDRAKVLAKLKQLAPAS